MNRKQRRATLKHGPPGAYERTCWCARSNQPALFLDALALEGAGKLDEAARGVQARARMQRKTTRRTTIARVFHAQCKTKDALIFYARALALMPQLFQKSSGNSRDARLASAAARCSFAPAGRQPGARDLRKPELFGEAGLASIVINQAAHSSAIDAGAPCRVRAPAHRAACSSHQ